MRRLRLGEGKLLTEWCKTHFMKDPKRLNCPCLSGLWFPGRYSKQYWQSSGKCSMKASRSVQLFVTPIDCSLPGSSVYGILQARILQWVPMPFPRGSS